MPLTTYAMKSALSDK